MTIEAILIMTLLLGVSITVTKLARDQGLLASLVEGPWGYVQGMIEDGVWVPPQTSRSYHPNLMSRHATPEGDTL